MAKVSEKQIQEWFEQFNKNFFGGALSNWKVQIGTPSDCRLGLLGYCEHKTRTIYITEDALVDKDEAAGNLLHEMAHARIGGTHSKRFATEIKRLQNEGAPVFPHDTKEWGDLIFPDDNSSDKNLTEREGGILVTEDLVRDAIDDAIMDGATLEQAQVFVANGLGLTYDGLLRLYPEAAKGTYNG